MMDMRVELRHLADADRYIAEGEARIARMRVLIAAAAANGHQTENADAALTSMVNALGTLVASRRLVLDAIKSIEADQIREQAAAVQRMRGTPQEKRPDVAAGALG